MRFNTSFTNSATYSFENAAPIIQSMIEPEDKIIYVGAYEADHTYSDITVTINEHSSPIVLFLSSYHAANWFINNPYETNIKGIIYSSYSPRSTVTTDNTVSLLYVDNMRYGYNDFSDPISDILNLSGKTPDQLYGEYGLSSVIIDIP